MEFCKTVKEAGERGLSGKYDKQSIGWKGALEGEMGKMAVVVVLGNQGKHRCHLLE